ncbi:MAG: asparagine synthetase B [Ignavibacteriales bacterium]|nr:asparagine synthetase B [Ignavibacteriales bacterium]MBI3786929.1 asparagine synthetase B [Ignavibacteriales bacterium]
MSGIVGMLNLDGAPIDEPLLRRMTESMVYRGPDALDIWVRGQVGLGYTMLRTTFESQREKQPCSLDGQVWIVADARIDDRSALIETLNREGQKDVESSADAELILHAYHVWGEACLGHLLGDFVFAIWDGRSQRLFCARDHFGIKLFYFARVGNCLVFSNTINSLRIHPEVSDDLDELAVADFLLFGFKQDPTITTFADIRRLPPAHFLGCSSETPIIRRYWNLPADDKIIRYKHADEYVDHFKELLHKSVADRLRTDRVAIWMSGGLDSTTLAAAACTLREITTAHFDLHAFCQVYDKLIPDQEGYYAGLAADALGIPIHYLSGDGYKLFERWDQPELHRPEPVEFPLLAQFADLLKQTAEHSRVVLFGEDPDALLYPPSIVDMVRCTSIPQVMVDIGNYALSYRQRPPLGLGIKPKLKRWLGKGPERPAYPTWLNRDFAERFELPTKFKKGRNHARTPMVSMRREAHRRIKQPMWQWIFEFLDSGATFYPLEVRLPYLDLRLVNYLLRIPPLPWCINKELLRVAMKGTLPDKVRLRPKTPLPGNPYHELLRQSNGKGVDDFSPVPELLKYVNRDAVPRVAGGVCTSEQSWLNLRPLCLNNWLQYQNHVNHSYKEESFMKPKDKKSSKDEKSISKNAASKKKAYRTPKLVAYGHIREITKTVGATGSNDGVTKTSL